MQKPEQKGRDYRNNNTWSTVKRSNKKSKRQNQENRRNEYRKSGQSVSGQSVSGQSVSGQSVSGQSVQLRVRNPVPEPVPFPVTIPKPTGPNYASIVKKDDDDNEPRKIVKSDDAGYITKCKPILSIYTQRFRNTVRNQIPKPSNNVSNNVWEHTYFKHILDLGNIFTVGTKKLGIETASVNFLDIFSDFIRQCSSGEISPYIEDLDQNTEEIYFEYTIKRNDL